MDTVTDLLMIAYTTNTPPYRYLYLTKRFPSGGWWYPLGLEEGYGSVTGCDLAIGPDSVNRVAYIFVPDGSHGSIPQVVLASGDFLGNWTWVRFLEPNPRTVSVAMDIQRGTPIIAFAGDNFNGTPIIGVYYYVDGGCVREVIDDTEFPVWQVSARVSPEGVQHIVYYEAPGPAEGSPRYVKHLSRNPWTGQMARGREMPARGMPRLEPEAPWSWTVDPVVSSGQLSGYPGDPVLQFGFMLDGETPIVGFEYKISTVDSSISRIYLAKPEQGALVPERPLAHLTVRGPWPNPGLRWGLGRISFDVPVRQEVELSLFDVTGKCVMKEVREAAAGVANWVAWDVRRLPAGMYWFRVRSRASGTVVRKWVILG
jgi:hypothetical protein